MPIADLRHILGDDYRMLTPRWIMADWCGGKDTMDDILYGTADEYESN
jgi:hypothetical protein